MGLRATLLAGAAPMVLAALAIVNGRSRWRASIAVLRGAMEGAREPADVTVFDARELEGLPAPVRRYFGAVLEDGRPVIEAAALSHSGTFNLGGTGDRWVPFTSVQHIVPRRPGFVWDARVRVAPGLDVFVHDAYAAGEGSLVAKLLGVLTVARQPSTPELAQGELTRFFAECVWCPTALLPSQGMRWEAVDDARARATMRDGDAEVTLLFGFDGQGLIESVASHGRYRDVDGEQVATPWRGRFWDYRARAGMLVPLEGEVEWVLPEGPRPYWRGRIERIKYEFAAESGPAR